MEAAHRYPILWVFLSRSTIEIPGRDVLLWLAAVVCRGRVALRGFLEGKCFATQSAFVLVALGGAGGGHGLHSVAGAPALLGTIRPQLLLQGVEHQAWLRPPSPHPRPPLSRPDRCCSLATVLAGVLWAGPASACPLCKCVLTGRLLLSGYSVSRGPMDWSCECLLAVQVRAHWSFVARWLQC